VTAPLNPNTLTNALSEITFSSTTNARVEGELVGSTLPSVVSLPPGTPGYAFYVARSVPGVASTVSLTVVDACGPWPTFVGGGATAF
jgi:hypothetical protein